jgi:hypothetical protein
MRVSAWTAAGLAIALGLSAGPALAQKPASKPAKKPDPCAITIKAEFEKESRGSTTFTLSPVHDGALYNWSLDNGNVSIGQGTRSNVIDNPPAGETVTFMVDAIDRPSCPDASSTATIKVKIPSPGAAMKVISPPASRKP